jgi:glycosyltransferase involved in cell wall biosynthesis
MPFSTVLEAHGAPALRQIGALRRTRIAQNKSHTVAKVVGEPKKITVIYNYYQKASTLFRSLESVQNQAWRRCKLSDLQIILVDDGTEDEDILDRLPDSVLYVWQRKNGYGISRAKNTGAYLSSGQFIVFLDPDIVICPTYFDAMLEQFDTYGDRLVQCGYIWDYHFVGCPDPRVEFGIWERPNRQTKRFYQVAGGNMAISSQLYFETPGFDEDLIYGGVEDLLFGYHLSKLPGTRIMFNKGMESWHIPHPIGAAHADSRKSWHVVKQKWPEFYEDYIVKGLR